MRWCPLPDQITNIWSSLASTSHAHNHRPSPGKLAGETARADAAEAGLATVTAAHEQSMQELDSVRKATSSEIARCGKVNTYQSATCIQQLDTEPPDTSIASAG